MTEEERRLLRGWLDTTQFDELPAEAPDLEPEPDDDDDE